MITKEQAETLVDQMIECVKLFESGRASWDAVKLHRKNMVQEILGGSPVEVATLRDQFAMAALTGLLANPNVIGHNSTMGWAPVNCDYLELAKVAQSIAIDSMQARGQGAV